MEERDTLKLDATINNDTDLMAEYKKKRNEVKDSLKKDRQQYSNKILDGKNKTSKEMWNSVKDILGLNKNLAPTQLKINGEIENNPDVLDNAFNNIFVDKVKQFRAQTNLSLIHISDPTRLRRIG